jgi:hypothetical protein
LRASNAGPPAEPGGGRVVVEHHQQVDVAVRSGRPAGAATEQDHPQRVEMGNHGIEQGLRHRARVRPPIGAGSTQVLGGKARVRLEQLLERQALTKLFQDQLAGMRVPLMQGLPPMTPGSIAIRSCRLTILLISPPPIPSTIAPPVQSS